MCNEFKIEKSINKFKGDVEKMEKSYIKCSVCGKNHPIEEVGKELSTGTETIYDICFDCIDELDRKLQAEEDKKLEMISGAGYYLIEADEDEDYEEEYDDEYESECAYGGAYGYL